MRLTVMIEPPFELEEPLSSTPFEALAAHLAEVVRAGLLEVESRLPATAPPEPIQTQANTEPRARPFRMSGGVGLVLLSGLEPGAQLGIGVDWFFSRLLGVTVSLAASVVPPALSLAEGVLRVRLVSGTVDLSASVPLSEQMALDVALGGGCTFLHFEGLSLEPFIGTSSQRLLPIAGGALKLRTRGRDIALTLFAAPRFLLQRVRLIVADRSATIAGPLLLSVGAGLEGSW